MGPRRDLRRTISALQKQFLNTEATGAERDSLKRRLLGLKKEYAALVKGKELTITDEEIDERTSVIESTPELAECFGAFWYVMLPQTVDGILQKPAYIKFQLALQQCLGGGTVPEAEALAAAESDWVQDAYLFGPMNRVAFFGVLFEVLHSWVDLQFTQNYAIFAWGLLTSIADLTSYPPQLRIRRTIPCLPLVKEAARLQAYRNDASLRKQIFEKISSAEYTAENNVQALARASQRTKQLTVTDVHEEDHMRSMLMVLHRQAVKNQTEQGSGTDTDDDTMTDSVHTAHDEIEWRRLETERLRKEEDDRIARFAAKKKRRGAPKSNRNSRSYYLEVGRGEGSDAAYDLYGDTSWGHLVGAKGGNWIGKQANLTGGWRAAALMEWSSN